ncbi:MAG: hypothetical protein ACHQ50_00075 [Fimbriimonadales bacterium]
MDKLGITRRQIADLAATQAEPAISIYVPTSRTGVDVLQGRIRLKNLLVEAEERLARQGMRPTLARDLLRPATDLLDQVEFWNDRLDSVALFISPVSFRAYHLPFPTPEYLEIGTHFHVRPLLRVLNTCQTYYVLALEQNHVRLVRCGPRGSAEVSVHGMPKSLHAFLATDHADKQFQYYSAGPAGRAGSIIGYGAGDKGVDHKERLHRFCIAIDRAVIEHTAPSDEPLVLASTQEIRDTYHSISKLPHLLAKGLTCSPKMLDDEELRQDAAPIIAEYADAARKSAIERYKELAGTGLTSQQIEEIVPAAVQGRVDVLLTYEGSSLWGKYDPAAGVKIDAEPLEGDEELINEAAIATIENGGSVYDIQHGELALAAPTATIFRY